MSKYNYLLDSSDDEEDEVVASSSNSVSDDTVVISPDITSEKEKYNIHMEINEITGEIIDASIKIHKILGPGLLESVYEEVLHYELNKRGLLSQRQVPLPVVYDNMKMEVGFRIDLLVEETVIVEVKSVETVTPFLRKNY